MAQQSVVGQGLLIIFTITLRHTTPVGLLWTNDQPNGQIST
jgi:hypothetical protein